MSPLLSALLIIFIIQLLFFIFAALKRTDKVTDLAYGATFAFVAILALVSNPYFDIWRFVLAAIVSIWGIRLSGYLFYRVSVIKRDKRFDGIRENPVKFGLFWLLQTVSIWLILSPTIIVLSQQVAFNFNLLTIIGGFVAISGIIVESIADMQKFNFKLKQPEKWADTGLWRYSRHPNYFGEILMWLGVFIYCVPYLAGVSYFSIISPLFITVLLLFVSGVPTIERKYDQKFAGNTDYQRYKQSTSLIIPWFKRL
jgi:steroid 5-alpha reductase family enzyme